MAARTTKKLGSVRGKDVLLDTCVFRYLADKGFRGQLRTYLRTLKTNKNNLAVSEISFFEIFRRDWSMDENRFYNRIMTARGLIQLGIDSNFLSNAAILCRHAFPTTIKQNDGNGKNIVADMILGGTVMANTSALLMTSNRSDFREPFWKVVSESFLTKKEADGWKGINLYLLQFDSTAIKPARATAVTLSSPTRSGASSRHSPPTATS